MSRDRKNNMPVGMDSIQAGARETIAKCLTEALFVIAGGSFPEEVERKKLRENVLTSISFPNKKNDSNSGKPHDIEVRLALSFFHRLRRMSVNGAVEIISDMGVTRHIDSPRELADRILLPLESACRKEGVAHDVRSQPSGLICIVTVQRSQVLRREGKLPCPLCTKWCQGTKGLWWHHHQNHKVEYSDAAEFAASSTDTMAIVPYDPDTSSGLPDHCHDLSASSTSIESNTPLEHVKTGNLKALRQDVEVRCPSGVSLQLYSPSIF